MKRIAVMGWMLAGCAPGVSDVAPGDGAAPVATCRVDAVAALVGKPLTPALQQEAQAKVGARTVRVIAPGTAVTMDYRPDRLNIEVGPDNKVTRLRCG